MDRFTESGPAEDRAWSAWADALKPGDSVRHEAGMVGEVVDFADTGVIVRYGGGDVVWPWDRVWPVEHSTLTTRGDSPAALIATAREAVEAAGRAVVEPHGLRFLSAAASTLNVFVTLAEHPDDPTRTTITVYSDGTVLIGSETYDSIAAAVEALLAEVVRG